MLENVQIKGVKLHLFNLDVSVLVTEEDYVFGQCASGEVGQVRLHPTPCRVSDC